VDRDYLRYYDLERYLFEDVHRRFHQEGSVGAFDFFSIVIWKANRAKSKTARRLLEKDPQRRGRLAPIVTELTSALYQAPDAQQRLAILLKQWGFLLPMATAILAVFWPDEFCVYDVRVCGQLGRFHTLGDKSDFEAVWEEYAEYLEAVRHAAPADLSLRDKDRYLWGQSVATQLDHDVEFGFRSPG
jgi:hypothetical protein